MLVAVILKTSIKHVLRIFARVVHFHGGEDRKSRFAVHRLSVSTNNHYLPVLHCGGHPKSGKRHRFDVTPAVGQRVVTLYRAEDPEDKTTGQVILYYKRCH